MTFETAKQLRAAGFPQTGRGTWFGEIGQYSCTTIYVPTVRELEIASDARVFKDKEGWTALPLSSPFEEEPRAAETSHQASAPDEALALLWLSLRTRSRSALVSKSPVEAPAKAKTPSTELPSTKLPLLLPKEPIKGFTRVPVLVAGTRRIKATCDSCRAMFVGDGSDGMKWETGHAVACNQVKVTSNDQTGHWTKNGTR